MQNAEHWINLEGQLSAEKPRIHPDIDGYFEEKLAPYEEQARGFFKGIHQMEQEAEEAGKDIGTQAVVFNPTARTVITEANREIRRVRKIWQEAATGNYAPARLELNVDLATTERDLYYASEKQPLEAKLKRLQAVSTTLNNLQQSPPPVNRPHEKPPSGK